MLNIIAALIEIYVVLLIIRALLSWVPVSPGSGFEPVVRFFVIITEPVLRPIRRILPPVRVGGMGLDLSVLIAIVVGQVLVGLLR